MFEPDCCFLFDNGSLRAASTLGLRRLATALAEAIGRPVQAVSLLHSSNVDAAELGGQPARLLEPALADFATNNPQGRAVALPLFFGPSGALTEYLPARLAALQARFPELAVRLARPLVMADDNSADAVAAAVEREVRRVLTVAKLARSHVILTDHGSPQPEVTAVRDRIAEYLQSRLGAEVTAVRAASMERRPGDDYAFNEPLLATALAEAGQAGARDVCVALQFLQPGRHAGPEGDIATICGEAKREYPALRVIMTEPLAQAPEILSLLTQRYREVVTSRGSRDRAAD